MDIVIENLSKSFQRQKVLDGFSHVFKAGSITCIMGKSGSGKTTLLSILMGLSQADSGKVTGLSEAKVSAVFQENRLCENLTAVLNVQMIAGEHHGKDEIIACFQKIGIDATDKKIVKEYSGGMKRRVAIVRALMAEFDILIMDEPLKGLDEETKSDVIALIKEYAKGKTVIMTTHDGEEPGLFQAEVLTLPGKK